MLEIILFLAVVAVDQAVKLYCASWLTTLAQGTYTVIDGVFSLTYVENRGAAFGMLQNAQVFFIIATLIVCAAIAIVLIKERGYMKPVMRIAITLILAGAVGNFIDRVALGYVRDMFYLVFIDFPVFNVADAAITVGGVTLALDVLFFSGKRYLAEAEEREKQRKAQKNGDK